MHVLLLLQIPVLLTLKSNEDSVITTLSAINNAQEHGILVRGVVIDDIADDCPKNILTSLPRLIEEYSNIKVLGLVPHINTSSPEDIITAILNGIDIESVFDVKIEKLEL